MKQKEKSIGEQVMSKYSSDEDDKEIEKLNEELKELSKELKKNLKELFWTSLKLFWAILNLCCLIYIFYIFLKYYHVI